MHTELATTVFQDLGVLHAIFNKIENFCRKATRYFVLEKCVTVRNRGNML